MSVPRVIHQRPVALFISRSSYPSGVQFFANHTYNNFCLCNCHSVYGTMIRKWCLSFHLIRKKISCIYNITSYLSERKKMPIIDSKISRFTDDLIRRDFLIQCKSMEENPMCHVVIYNRHISIKFQFWWKQSFQNYSRSIDLRVNFIRVDDSLIPVKARRSSRVTLKRIQ